MINLFVLLQMIDNYIIYLVIIGYFLIHNSKLTKHIKDEYYKKTGVSYTKAFSRKLFNTFYIVIFYIIVLIDNNYTYIQSTLLSSLFFILYINYVDSSISDPTLHLISKWTLRFSYLMTFLLIYLLIQNFNSGNDILFLIIITIITLFILFFIITGVGSSDFRCLFIVVPSYIFFFGQYSLLAILLSLLYVMFYQKRIQRKLNNNKAPVPIGDKILLFGPFFMILAVILNNFGKI